MERYNEYKDSGVQWIGEIPSHWNTRKMKFCFTERSQKGFINEPLLASTQNFGVIRKDMYDNRTVEATKNLDTLKLVEIGDFVISLRSFQGGIEYAYCRGIISPAYTILCPVHIKAEYFKYLGKSPIYISLLKSTVTGIREGQNIDYSKLRVEQLPIPSISEQLHIANYLDSITAKIEEAIAQQQKMIDLLNERKQIIINQAVTKGLDPGVPMKDSGVDWIGEIPQHWGLQRWRLLLIENKTKNTSLKVRVQLQFRYGNIIRKTNQDEDADVLKAISKYSIVAPKDIMINGLNLNYDFVSQRVAQVKECGIITSAYISLRPTSSADSNYYTYLLKAMDYKKMFHGMGTGIRLTLSYNELKNQFIPFPSLKEQQCIANYLDSVTSKIDIAIAQQQKMIDLLNERKQIIINDVVTGKIRVI